MPTVGSGCHHRLIDGTVARDRTDRTRRRLLEFLCHLAACCVLPMVGRGGELAINVADAMGLCDVFVPYD